MTKFVLTRNVTTAECPWLNPDMEEGDIVYSYPGYTYGCIGPHGAAVSLNEDAGPFFELPKTAIQELK